MFQRLRDRKLLDAYERGYALQQEYLGTDKPVNRIEPLVSVCTITYQHAPFIRQCLDSILMQETDFPWEFIIGEDGSTDGTREICIEYAERHPDRIRLFLRDRSLSQYQEGDRTIRFNGHWTRRATRGKYIAICEGDDYWTDPKKLQKQVSFLESHPYHTMCFHNVVVIRDMGEIDSWHAYGEEMKPDYGWEDLCTHNFVQTCSVMYRVCSFPRSSNASWMRLPMGDWAAWIQLAMNGPIAYLPDLMGTYRQHEGGVWTRLTERERCEGRLSFLVAIRRELRLQVKTLDDNIRRTQRHLIAFLRENANSRDASHQAKRLVLSSSFRDLFIERPWSLGLLSIYLRGEFPFLWSILKWCYNKARSALRYLVASF